VEKLAGLLFAYMGPPEKRPLLPRWDMMVKEGYRREISISTPVINCNWLQATENSADPLHTYYLHGYAMRVKSVNQGAYLYRPVEKFEVEQTEWGVRKKRTYTGEDSEAGHLLIFPNIVRHPRFIRWNVPIDDTHMETYSLHFFQLKDDGETVTPLEDIPVRYESTKDERGNFHMKSIPSQDRMAWETQGPICDRAREHLGESDQGIILYRKILADQISIVQKGGEPIALVRDPEKNKIIEFTTTERLPSEEEQIVYRREGTS
jgi:5,5'-dehydrodivanillate O-demethylase